MNRRQFVRRLPAVALSSVAPFSLSACGTLFHPDRVGQPRCGRLDPAIVALNGLGLLLFLVPGLIAFAVDFYTGAIYLPPGYAANGTGKRDGRLLALHVDPRTLTRRRIETEISTCIGKPVSLDPGTYRVRELEDIDRFEAAAGELIAMSDGEVSTNVIFRAQSD
ncbi:MAG: hypothetical protein DWQ34_18275 [Planctomycetota bacterium]|nr:MAG: hypothetical protein DWQ34_18275 [Planctomycetota bacterium]REJ95967.1 MAG: hypothetical protein DWQ29_01295 [Planctomycetota bacterium]REK21522.1 MAG: hypothetical protein DWQ41_20835 [Planctomycetota bacterium]REK39923.1 MAG: hypothetical protein DWQ45_01260 [Planctomycetota bacterium]